MKEQRNMFQTKAQDKTPETYLNEMEKSVLPNEFNIIVIEILRSEQCMNKMRMLTKNYKT